MIKARPTSRGMYSALVSTLVSVQTLVRPFEACTRVWTDTGVDTRPRTSLSVGLVYVQVGKGVERSGRVCRGREGCGEVGNWFVLAVIPLKTQLKYYQLLNQWACTQSTQSSISMF